MDSQTLQLPTTLSLADSSRPQPPDMSEAPTLAPPTPSQSSTHLPTSSGAPNTSANDAPEIQLILLLVSGRRRTMSFDPSITISRMKELTWNSWPSEWVDEQPPAPSFLRVLHLGKIIQDDSLLSSCFSLSSQPTTVHISVRPFGPNPDEDISKAKTKRNSRRVAVDDEEASTGGCCGSCVIC